MLLLLEGLFSEAGLVPVEGAGETGAVVFGCEQLLLARRTRTLRMGELCLRLDILGCPQTSLQPFFLGTGNTASAAFL